MTCRNLGGGVIACGPPGIYRRRILPCPACERRHRFVESWGGAWYGPTYYGACGDEWQEGYRMQRPFRRGWRKEAQQRFRDRWQHATSAALYDQYVRADRNTVMARSNKSVIKLYRKRAVVAELIRRERTAA